MSETEKDSNSTRKVWTKKETLGFLNCYNARKQEFYHSRKKKYAYENVLKDMIAQGITTSATTAPALKGKMRTLLMGFKAAKINDKTTTTIGPFMNLMEEIFTDNPIFSMETFSYKTITTDTSDEDKSQMSLNLHKSYESRDDSSSMDTNGKRRVWSKKETLGLLKCFIARKEEFDDCMKKKFGYENVLNDMIQQNLTSSSTTTNALIKKMRSLLSAYRAAIENGNNPYLSPNIAPYVKEMKEIFGDTTTMEDDHTLRIGTDHTLVITKIDPFDYEYEDEDHLETSHQAEEIFGDEPIISSSPITIKPDPDDYSDDDQLQSSPQREQVLKARTRVSIVNGHTIHTQVIPITTDCSDEDQLQRSSPSQVQRRSFDEEQIFNPKTPTNHLPSQAALSKPETLFAHNFRKRKSAQEIFFENKLKLKKQEMHDKKLMWEAKHEQREKFMRESLNALQKKWDKDHEVELRKLELLEKLINK